MYVYVYDSMLICRDPCGTFTSLILLLVRNLLLVILCALCTDIRVPIINRFNYSTCKKYLTIQYMVRYRGKMINNIFFTT